MTPGKPRILTCPFCGTEKEVFSLNSGNTFETRIWSDGKRVAPMLPRVSFVQKCPKCSKYYIISRQEVRYADDGWSFELGNLNYREMIDAFNQLKAEGFSDNEEGEIRILLFHTYNDLFRGEQPEDFVLDEADKELLRENMLWLIKNCSEEPIFVAEVYREIGEMDKAKECIEQIHPTEDHLIKITDAIKRKIDQNDTKVFEITNLFD